MKYYLAYGSNLNLRQMVRRCPDAERIGTAYLTDTRLIFRGSGSGFYLSIEPAKGCTVPVGVFRVSASDERALDHYEGYPSFYGKKTYSGLTVFGLNGRALSKKYTAMAYVLPTSAPVGFPSHYYMETCAEGYRDFGFDVQYLLDALTATGEEWKNDEH